MGDRHHLRAQWHDYNDGVYFVTICSYQKTHIFGHIQAGTVYSTTLGKIVDEHINKISEYHKDAEVWNYVVMSDHVHYPQPAGI